MKNNEQLAPLVKNRRQALGLTQHSLAKKLGVEASHIAFIENGRRKPSLELMARLADILGIDRQKLLILAHPEAKELIAEAKPEERRKTTTSWQRFINNHELLDRYQVTDSELRALEEVGFLGTVRSGKEYLAILTLLRDVRPIKQN